MFVMTGFFRLSEWMLCNAKSLVDDKNIRDVACYQWANCSHNWGAGKWTEIPEYDKLLFAAATREGLFWDMAAYTIPQGAVKVYQGEFSKGMELVEKWTAMEEEYQYGPLAARNALLAEFLVVRRRLFNAHTEANNAISLSIVNGVEPWELQSIGWRAITQVLMKDVSGAKDSLTQSEQIRRKQVYWPPLYLRSSLLGQFMLDLHLLEDAIGGESRSLVSEYSKAALRSGKAAVKNSAKFAAHRTENYRLMSVYYWLIGKHRKALKWFDKSIKEGERLGARPDLSRTYMEVGKRLLEPHSKYKELNGITATAYLDKAETMFRDMDLEWDLEQLERVRQMM
jgi:hypothetical protein